jgi:hypothetical protein
MSKKKLHHASHAETNQNHVERPVEVAEKHEVDRSQSIQIRAYTLWEQAGRPDGEFAREGFWCEAEKEFRIPTSGSM